MFKSVNEMGEYMKLSSSLSNRAHSYMHDTWSSGDEGWHDYSAADASGDTELMAHILCQAGAINSKTCYEYAQEIEKIVEQLAKKFRKLSKKDQSARYEMAFKDCFISECNSCNNVSFVHSGNENIYPELKKECWECGSKDINTKKGLE